VSLLAGRCYVLAPVVSHRGSAQRSLLGGGPSRWPGACCRILLDQLATLNLLPGWGRLTPHDAAAGSGPTDMITWLDGQRSGRRLTAAGLPARAAIRLRNSGRFDLCVQFDRAGHAAGRDGRRDKAARDRRTARSRTRNVPGKSRCQAGAAVSPVRVAPKCPAGTLVARWWRGRSALLRREDANGARVRQV